MKIYAYWICSERTGHGIVLEVRGQVDFRIMRFFVILSLDINGDGTMVHRCSLGFVVM